MADELNKGQQAIGERLAELLAGSLLDSRIKEELLDNLDKMPEHVIFGLIDSLEKEKEKLASLASDLEFLGSQKDKEWEQLQDKQAATAGQVIDEFLKEKEKEAKIEEAKASLR